MRNLLLNVTPPDLETRIAIFKKKAKQEGLDIPNEVMLYRESNRQQYSRTRRRINQRVVAYSSLINKDINADLAAEALKILFLPQNQKSLR